MNDFQYSHRRVAAEQICVARILPMAALITLSAVGVAQQPALGQRPQMADSSPARIMSEGGRWLPSSTVDEVLRQQHKSYPLEKRRELAESVTARAIRGTEDARNAVIAIGLSGSANLSLGGTPDPDALDRLVRIQREAAAEVTRLDALTEMVEQVNPTRALPHLNTLARSSGHESAIAAMFQLNRFAFGMPPIALPVDREAAAAVLRRLYNDLDSLKSASAIGELCDLANAHAWPAKAPCRGRASLDAWKTRSEISKNFLEALAVIVGAFALWMWLVERKDRAADVLLRLEEEFRRPDIMRGRQCIEDDRRYMVAMERLKPTEPDSNRKQRTPIGRRALEGVQEDARCLDALLRFYVVLHGIRDAKQVPESSLSTCFRYWLAHYWNPKRGAFQDYVDANFPTLRRWLDDDAEHGDKFFTPKDFGWKSEGLWME